MFMELGKFFELTEELFNLPPMLLLAICSSESDFRNVVNPDDGGSPSYGICQIKLNTARTVGFQGRPKKLMHQGVNIYYAGAYLSKQLKRYKGNTCAAIAAYNLGKAKYVGTRIKNTTYVRRVTTRWGNYYQATGGVYDYRGRHIRHPKNSSSDLARLKRTPLKRTDIGSCHLMLRKRKRR